MPELTTQSMERLKSSAKQDQEHVAYILFIAFCISCLSSLRRMARVESREKISSGFEREVIA